MSSSDKRLSRRNNSTVPLTPISCQLIWNQAKVSLKVINYHFRGACFQAEIGDTRVLDKNCELRFTIGTKELSEPITYRVSWETISQDGLFGVEFSTESSYVLARAQRFDTHTINQPVVSSPDPLDPNRTIYFKTINISNTGLLLSTSLTNRHVLPGMELHRASLDIPGIGKTTVDLFIENSRAAEDGQTVQYGASVKGNGDNYHELIAKYLSNLGRLDTNEDRLEKLAENGFVQKQLSRHLTIVEVTDQKAYDDVLKLRFLGYRRAGKTLDTATHKDMGDGLDKEGIVLAAYLGGQLVASCEFRFAKKHGLRLTEKLDLAAIQGVRDGNLSEINKLVVHPSAQNTDIVLGIFQKIHALAMLNGRPDGLITAEDRLVPLYKRLGFKKTGQTLPHPTKSNITLNLMVIQSETYATSEGMNPYAWSMAFQDSYKFFSDIGIQTSFKMTFAQHLEKFVTAIALKFVGLKKKKRKATHQGLEKQQQRENKIDIRNTSDPRWTKQHVNATVLFPYVLEAEGLIGAEKIHHILSEYGLQKDYFKKTSNWVSIEFFDSFIEKFAAFGDPYLLNRKAGYRATSKEVLGANYFIIKNFFSPRIAFKSFESFLPKFNKTRTFKLIDSGPTHCRIRITNLDVSLLPKHHSTRENWIALIDSYVQILTGKPASITVVKSSFDGDAYCEYVVKWQNPLLTVRGAVTSLLALGAASYCIPKFQASHTAMETVVGASLVIGIASAVFFFLQWKKYSKRYREMIDALSAYEKDADERYRELQTSKAILEKSYQEGRILETINREIQTSEDLTKILEIALDSACTQFDFKRAFTMIIDDETKSLRTAAVFGADSPVQDLWNFKVDVSVKRDNPTVLSSVYHTGQSILINEIEDHLFHLNETSKRLIKQLQARGFAIVPIPSNRRNWGVLVADKGSQGDIISRRDLVALQRVSQSIGLALDKKAKIDSEVRARKIFQKYVPLNVVQSIEGSHEPQLGGESREAICLFCDIRNFTSMSSQMPPQILVELLNSVFEQLQQAVAETGGVIDKFLGDGALVTWGAVPGSPIDPMKAIRMASLFSEKLCVLNTDLVKKGMPQIEVGFGLHKGPLIAGNIGSNDRMEFTVIGSTVNVASRLEQLTKAYKCTLVVSDSMTDLGSLGSDWEVHKAILVRGVDKPLDIACLKIEQLASTTKRSA